MLKADIKNKLDELGVEYDSTALKEDLQEKLDEATTVTAQVEDEPEEDTGEAIVMRGNVPVRSYTLERHGKDYNKLAETYVSTRDDDSLHIAGR